MERITELIPTGKKNAISMKTLSNRIGSTTRKTREYVQRARLQGDVICGDMNGYYIPGSIDEAKEYYSFVHNKAVKSLAAAKSARLMIQHFERANGQSAPQAAEQKNKP